MKKRKRKNKKNAIVKLLNTASEINQAAVGFLIPGAGNLGVLIKNGKTS